MVLCCPSLTQLKGHPPPVGLRRLVNVLRHLLGVPGVDLSLVSDAGETARQLAERKGDEAVLKVFAEFGL